MSGGGAANRYLTAVFDIGHPLPGSERKLMDLAGELHRRGYPAFSYVSPHFLSWGHVGIALAGGSIVDGEHSNLALWHEAGGVSLTPLCGFVPEIADHLDNLRKCGWHLH